MKSRDTVIREYLGESSDGGRRDGLAIYRLLKKEDGVLLLEDDQDKAELKRLVDTLMRKALHNVDLLNERLGTANYMFAMPEYRRIPAPADAAAQVDAFEAECGRFVPMIYRSWYEIVGSVCLMGTHPGWPQITYNGLGGEIGAVCSDPLVAYWTPEIGRAMSYERIEFAPDPGHKANYSSSGSYNLPITDSPSIDAFVTNDDDPTCRRTFLDHLRQTLKAAGFPGWKGKKNAPTASLNALKQDFQDL